MDLQALGFRPVSHRIGASGAEGVICLGSAGLGRGNTKNDDCRANSNARGLSEGLLCRCRRCDVVGCRVEDLMRAVVESEVKRWWACLLAAKSRRGQHANTLWDVYDTVYGVLGSWILDR